MDYKQKQGLIISMKTLFILYITFSFLIAYENVVFLDPVWGQIFTTAVLFVVPYLLADYIIAIMRFRGTLPDQKLGGIFILDLFIDHAPRFPTKHGFEPDWKGFALQIILGFLVFNWFWGQTTVTGEIFAGVPNVVVPAQFTPSDSADKAALVAPPEDALSTTLTSLFGLIIFFGMNRLGVKKGFTLVFIALLVGSYLSSLYMADLHSGVYKYNEPAKQSIQKFFFVGNIVSSVTNAQYAFDIYHGLWNRELIKTGRCLGC